jgi:hypothetical protein
MTRKILITALPVASNFFLLYLLLPSIYTFYGVDDFNSSVLIYTFFSAAGVLTLGVPIMLTKELSKKNNLQGVEWSYLPILSLLLFLYTIFFFASTPDYYYLLFLVPILSYISLKRGVEEGLKNFTNSAVLRIIFFVLMPVVLILNVILGGEWEYVFSIVSLVIFVLYFMSCLKIEVNTSFHNIKKIYPYAIQSLYVFLFVFLDRALLWILNPGVNVGQFIYEYEFIYRAMLPYTLVLIVLFPYMSSVKEQDIKKANIYAALYLLLFSILIAVLIYNLKEIYLFFNLSIPIDIGRYSFMQFLYSIIALCIGVFLQKKIISLAVDQYLGVIFLSAIVFVTAAGVLAVIYFGDALSVITVKVTAEIFILCYFLRRIYCARN